MKISNVILSAFFVVLFSVPAFAQESDKEKEKKDPQDLRSWTVGVKGLYLYDVFSSVYDSDISRDMQGLNGDKTSLDFGVELSVEKQFTPFFGVRGDFRYGGLTGANDLEYYENTFYSARVAAMLIWNNLDPRNVGSKLNFYTPIGGGLGTFDAQRFLISDDSPNGGLNEAYAVVYGGAGVMYELSSNWRLDLEVNYNIVRSDGFDGFDYNTAWDPYLSVGLGVSYTFGSAEKPAMYATNYFESPYYDVASQKERLAELEAQVGNLTKKQEEEMEELKKTLESLGAMDEEQNRLIRDLKNNNTESTNPVVVAQNEGYKAVIFFNFDSAVLTKEAQQTLLQKLAGNKGPFTIVGYADQVGTDEYNEQLKMKRANTVKDFLINQMGFAAGDISLETGKIDVNEQNAFLRRRVEIR